MPVQRRRVFVLGQQDDRLVVAAQVLEPDLRAGLLRRLEVEQLLDQRMLAVVRRRLAARARPPPPHIREQALRRARRLDELHVALRPHGPRRRDVDLVQQLVAPAPQPLEQIARADRRHDALRRTMSGECAAGDGTVSALTYPFSIMSFRMRSASAGARNGMMTAQRECPAPMPRAGTRS